MALEDSLSLPRPRVIVDCKARGRLDCLFIHGKPIHQARLPSFLLCIYINIPFLHFGSQLLHISAKYPSLITCTSAFQYLHHTQTSSNMAFNKVLSSTFFKQVMNGGCAIDVKFATSTEAQNRVVLSSSVMDPFADAIEKADVPTDAVAAFLT